MKMYILSSFTATILYLYSVRGSLLWVEEKFAYADMWYTSISNYRYFESRMGHVNLRCDDEPLVVAIAFARHWRSQSGTRQILKRSRRALWATC